MFLFLFLLFKTISKYKMSVTKMDFHIHIYNSAANSGSKSKNVP